MDNQHRRITGYRELNQTEIDLMNEIKALGPVIEAVLMKVNKHIAEQSLDAANTNQQDVVSRLEDATPQRFHALAKTEFQTGLMYLTRAVAQPTFF